MSHRKFVLKLSGGTFRLVVGSGSGNIRSNLHYGSLEEFLADGGDTGDLLGDRENFGRYEGAIDAVESFVLAAAQAGLDVQDEQFEAALPTTLDAIGNEL